MSRDAGRFQDDPADALSARAPDVDVRWHTGADAPCPWTAADARAAERSGTVAVLRSMTEKTTLTDAQLRCCALAHETWVPTEWHRAVYRRAGCGGDGGRVANIWARAPRSRRRSRLRADAAGTRRRPRRRTRRRREREPERETSEVEREPEREDADDVPERVSVAEGAFGPRRVAGGVLARVRGVGRRPPRDSRQGAAVGGRAVHDRARRRALPRETAVSGKGALGPRAGGDGGGSGQHAAGDGGAVSRRGRVRARHARRGMVSSVRGGDELGRAPDRERFQRRDGVRGRE